MKRLLTLTAVLLSCSTALANMPPKNLDIGNERMTEAQVLRAYSSVPGFDKLELHRVPFGEARTLCLFYDELLESGGFASLPTYGCSIDYVIVYSYDTPALARSQKRRFSKNMANHVLRHEFAHALFGWPASHPNDCETICDEEGF